MMAKEESRKAVPGPGANSMLLFHKISRPARLFSLTVVGCTLVLCSYPTIRQDYVNAYLTQAVRNGDYNEARRYLDRGADPNTQLGGFGEHNSDQPILFMAIFHHRVEIVRLLLDYGASANVRSDYHGSPLIYAISNGDGRPNIVELLIQRGADIHYRTASGKTALDVAKEQGLMDCAKLLQHAGVPR